MFTLSLVGGVVVPLLAQHNVTIAYFIPVGMLSIGVLLFLSGSSRYVKSKPPVDKLKLERAKAYQGSPGGVASDIRLDVIVRISLLIVPL
jgi:hypothetical protein